MLSHKEKEVVDSPEMKGSECSGDTKDADHEDSSPTLPNMPKPGCKRERGLKKRKCKDAKVMCAIYYKVLTYGNFKPNGYATN